MNDPCGGDIYIDDFRYDTTTNMPYVNSYTITNNIFGPGNTIDVGSGAGEGTPASNRLITDNTFEGGGTFGGTDGNGPAPAISFNGSGSGVDWFLYPVGGATITGNTFAPHDQYIRARGTYDTASFDWNSYFADNTFPAASLTTTPTNDVQTYTYSFNEAGYGCPGNTCTWNNVRRINGTLQAQHGPGCAGADCNGDIDNALPGDTVEVQGTFNESVRLTQAVSLLGFGTTATLNGTSGPVVAVNSPGALSISNLHFTGPTPSVDVGSSSAPPTVTRNQLLSLVNGSAATVNGTCNYWGQGTGPLAGQTTGPVDSAGWLLTSNLAGPCPNVVGPPTITSVFDGPAPYSGDSLEVAFTLAAPVGPAVTSETVTCVSLAGGPAGVATGTGSPIFVGGPAVGPYQCTVTATNADGTSVPSAPFIVLLGGSGDCPTIPTAPTVLSTGPGNSSATVSWAPSVGCVAGYVVTPYIGGVAQRSVLIPGPGTTTVMSGLTNGVAYTFTVAAENGRALSPLSTMTGPITAGAPAAVTGLRVTRAGRGCAQDHVPGAGEQRRADPAVHRGVYVDQRTADRTARSPRPGRSPSPASAQARPTPAPSKRPTNAGRAHPPGRVPSRRNPNKFTPLV